MSSPERPCQARWKSGSRYHVADSMCGETETEQFADLWLCEHHARRLEDWADRREARLREDRRAATEEIERRRFEEKAAKSIVYFVERDGFIKIGYTTNLRSRLAAIRNGSAMPEGLTPGPVELLGTVPGGIDEERLLHARFSEHRLDRCEWFYPAPELLDYIRASTGLVGAR